MTAITMVLLGIGGLIGMIAWIWLLVLAFRSGIGWGLSVLLLSWTWIPVILFAVRHWDAAKRPVMLWAVGFFFSLAGYLLIILVPEASIASILEKSADFDDRSGVATETESSLLPPPRPTAVATHPSWEAVVKEVERDDAASWEAMVPTPTPISGRPDEGRLSWDELTGQIGTKVILDLNNDTTITAALEAVEPHRLRIRHVIGGGEASYWIDREQIERIRVAN